MSSKTETISQLERIEKLYEKGPTKRLAIFLLVCLVYLSALILLSS